MSEDQKMADAPAEPVAAAPAEAGAAGLPEELMDVEMDEETRKAVQASLANEKSAAEAADQGEKNIPITDKVNQELLGQLKEMGFPDVRAEKALWLTGNENLEAAINWLADHGDDADIDVPHMISEKEANKPKLSKEEQKAMLDERIQKYRADKAKKEKDLEKQQEIARIAMSKELNAALKLQKEQEEKLAQEKAKREKEQDARDRARVKAELEKDRMERMAAKGIKPGETAAKPAKPEDPHRDQKLNLGSRMRDIIGFHRNDPSTPNPATKALETCGKYVDNIIKNPTEEKFRSINPENAAFQRLVGGKKGGPEVIAAIGFKEIDGKLTIADPDVEWLKKASEELQLAVKRGPFY